MCGLYRGMRTKRDFSSEMFFLCSEQYNNSLLQFNRTKDSFSLKENPLAPRLGDNILCYFSFLDV